MINFNKETLKVCYKISYIIQKLASSGKVVPRSTIYQTVWTCWQEMTPFPKNWAAGLLCALKCATNFFPGVIPTPEFTSSTVLSPRVLGPQCIKTICTSIAYQWDDILESVTSSFVIALSRRCLLVSFSLLRSFSGLRVSLNLQVSLHPEAARATNPQQTWRQESLGCRSSTVERPSTRASTAGNFLQFF